jgi:large subunit ribosomal protein L29
MKEAKKIRQKNIKENEQELDRFYEKLVNLNFEKETGTLRKVHQIKQTKKQIARLLTIIQEEEKRNSVCRQTGLTEK